MELKTPSNNGQSSNPEPKLEPPNPCNGETHKTDESHIFLLKTLIALVPLRMLVHLQALAAVDPLVGSSTVLQLAQCTLL
ncbi:uncharacterized protein Pyn_36029 [Prunus yedoensis var. nudiflora]|uniref:Uncharacterized protein n=1 Tax=Prunus yedoensis var. nudiflora TaxID=2094558 RepID=A0A314XQD3_PRUYE|nr:uncharacterized protein Pyn_36029 [Prunus yedoensis var. nudiflora]